MPSNLSVHFTQRLKIEIETEMEADESLERERDQDRKRVTETEWPAHDKEDGHPWGKSLQWGQEDRMTSLLSSSLTKHFTTITRLTIIFTSPNYYLASPNLQPIFSYSLPASFPVPFLAMVEQFSVLPSSSALLSSTPSVHKPQLK